MRKIIERPRTSIRTFKHIQATNIWAFVNGEGHLNDEEQNHLRRCRHCAAIFKYFAVYSKLPPDVFEKASQAA